MFHQFKDWDQVPDWLKPFAQIAVKRGLIRGYPDGTLHVDQPVTRAELIVGLAMVAILAEELLNADRSDLADAVADTVVEVKVGGGTGSGVVVAPGRVVTNAHVVGASPTALVRWTSPRTRMSRVFGPPCTVLRSDPAIDLALIEVPTATTHMEIDPGWIGGDLEAIDREHHSELLYTFGNPLGISGVMSAGLFVGHRFAYGGLWLAYTGGINPGNSGGPLFNVHGRLVGLVAAKPLVRDSSGSGDYDPADDLALAVPALVIQRFLEGEV